MGQLESIESDSALPPPPPRSTLFVVRNGRYEPQNLMPVLPRSDILDFDGFVMRRGVGGGGMNARPPEMRQGSLIKNPMNVRRDSARIMGQIPSLKDQSPISNSDSVLSFIFDAQRGGNLSVHLLVKEIERPLNQPPGTEEKIQEEVTDKAAAKKKDAAKEAVPREIELHPQDIDGTQEAPVALELDSIRYAPGLGQTYKSPAFNFSRWPQELLSFDPARPKDIPIAVRMEAEPIQGEPKSVHYTYISLLRGRVAAQENLEDDEPQIHTSNTNCTTEARPVQIYTQKMQYGDQCFVLHEVFGVTSKATNLDAEGGNQDCVICLSEPRDTAVLPCRHMCFCSYCAGIVRLQCDRCPVCRQKVASLLQFKRGQDPLEELRGEGPSAGKLPGTQERKGSLTGAIATAPTAMASAVASSAAAAASRRPSHQNGSASRHGSGSRRPSSQQYAGPSSAGVGAAF